MLVYTYDYDGTFDPAMPMLKIQVAATANQDVVWMNVQIDSGADGTSPPLDVLRRIGARKYQKNWLRTVIGQRTQIDLYRVAVQVADMPVLRLGVAGAPHLTEAIIGRDLLNQLVLKFDGPAMVVELLTP